MKDWVTRQGGTPDEVNPELADGSVAVNESAEPATSAADRLPGVGGLLSKRKHNDAVLEKLQEGYAQVIDLMSSIQEHQRSQDVRATEISNSLAQIASTLSSVESGESYRAETLTRIADELHAGNERAEHWEDVITEFPKMAETQREALISVARQMEAVGSRDSQLAQSLESFRDAVSSLGDATTASSVAVKNLQMSALESHDRTAALMKEQNKRFVMLFVVTLVLVAVSVTTAVIALWNN